MLITYQHPFKSTYSAHTIFLNAATKCHARLWPYKVKQNAFKSLQILSIQVIVAVTTQCLRGVIEGHLHSALDTGQASSITVLGHKRGKLSQYGGERSAGCMFKELRPSKPGNIYRTLAWQFCSLNYNNHNYNIMKY